MALDWDGLLSDADRRLQSSAIRDLLAVTAQPEVISFAGGLPAPEYFPVEALRASFDAVLRDDGRAALQYGPTEGYLPLRAFLAERLAARGIVATPEQILITSGSQQALDLIGKALLSRGDSVLVESPSYVGALQAFTTREVRYLTVEMDDEGLRVDQAAQRLAGLPPAASNGHGAHAATQAPLARPRLAYTVATFQNPSGVTMSRARREALLALCATYALPLIEDDPYGELRFEGEEVPPLRALPGGEDTIYLGTFSKILAPGLRVGWVVAPRPLLRRLVLAKQAADLQCDSLTQRAILHYCRHNDIQATIAPLRRLYHARRDAMLQALARYFPAEARWTRPEGGLFIWVTLPDGLDGRAMLKDAVERRVAFVPGSAGHMDGKGTSCLRL
ncbi:MAG TPA: PLP-dependent aminotransferase family protein, partial [Chloroflexota bacterium]|nr:PLP-dependent aminotransferase family protein [Chloroflexota bacterium]